MESRSTSILLLLVLVSSACQPRTSLPAEEPTDVPQATYAPAEVSSPTGAPAEEPVEVPGSTSTPESAAVQPLELVFADPDWDGKEVPAGQQCNRQGGQNPATPRIQVSNIPDEADALILEFSDRTYAPMDRGGHGKVGVEISKGTGAVVVPAVPGHTFELPQGVFLVQEHRAASFDTAGAYMPPCSGGAGNSYYVTVKAVRVLSKEEKTFVLLGQGALDLGKY